MTPGEEIPQPYARIIDGMGLVQKIRGDQKIFAEVAATSSTTTATTES